MQKITSVRGVQDFIGDEASLYYIFSDNFRKTCGKYNFNFIKTPIFEKESLFVRPLGDDSDIVNKEMYSFEDKSGEKITLRPEGTAPVIRSVIENNLLITLPLKLAYFGPMFRYERPQKGRYRQFHQFGIELLGDAVPYRDYEVIELALSFSESIGIDLNTVNIQINSLGNDEDRGNFRCILKEYFEKYFNDLSEVSKIRFQKNPLRILDSKEKEDQEIINNAPSIYESLSYDSKKYFDEVCSLLGFFDVKFEIDQKLVRGLDYYTHTVFEFKSDKLGAQSTFLAGGRYDNLVSMLGGKNCSGIGWAAGYERLKLISSLNVDKEDFVAVISDDNISAMKILKHLRKSEIRSELFLGNNFSSLMKKVVKNNPKYVIFNGIDERTAGCIKIKNLVTFEQANISFEDLINFIKV